MILTWRGARAESNMAKQLPEQISSYSTRSLADVGIGMGVTIRKQMFANQIYGGFTDISGVTTCKCNYNLGTQHISDRVLHTKHGGKRYAHVYILTILLGKDFNFRSY